MRGLVVIKTAYRLNAIPLSCLNNCKFPTMCTIKKVHKNNPVRPITNFLPSDDENNLVTQFMLLMVFSMPANLSGLCFIKSFMGIYFEHFAHIYTHSK